jgi:glycosyltransferase involved in cell wall biosynthesis
MEKEGGTGMTGRRDIVLAGAARFHIPQLASAFEEMERLRSVSFVSLRPSAPAGVPLARFHNYFGLAVQRKARARLKLEPEFFSEYRHLGEELARRVAREDAGVLHAWNSIATEAFLRLSGRGWIRCLERSCPHNLYQYELLREEGDLLGFPHKEDMDGLARAVDELYLADVIAVPSLYSAGSYSDPQLKAKVRINTLGSNYVYRERAPRKDNAFRILMVGNDFLRKGSHYLIEAFRLLDMPDAELYIRGQIPDAYLCRLNDPRIHVVPEILPAALHALYDRADVFVQPSVDEGFGMTVLEALAHGLPVVATENVGAKDLLGRNVSRIVPIRNPEALARAILEARHLAGAVFDAERKRILERNSWRACAERMISEVYHHPINSGTCVNRSRDVII